MQSTAGFWVAGNLLSGVRAFLHTPLHLQYRRTAAFRGNTPSLQPARRLLANVAKGSASSTALRSKDDESISREWTCNVPHNHQGKVYAVAHGRQQGIFKSWDEAKEHVDKFPGARFKSFKTLNAAETWMIQETTPKPQHATQQHEDEEEEEEEHVAARNDQNGAGALSIHPRRMYIVEFDGGSRGNPGIAGYGAVVRDGKTMAVVDMVIGCLPRGSTNNQAEYRALVAGLKAALDLGVHKVTVHGDSELALRQLSGEYSVRNADLKPLVEEVNKLTAKFKSCSMEHVERGLNAAADRLANHAMDVAEAAEQIQADIDKQQLIEWMSNPAGMPAFSSKQGTATFKVLQRILQKPGPAPVHSLDGEKEDMQPAYLVAAAAAATAAVPTAGSQPTSAGWQSRLISALLLQLLTGQQPEARASRKAASPELLAQMAKLKADEEGQLQATVPEQHLKGDEPQNSAAKTAEKGVSKSS